MSQVSLQKNSIVSGSSTQNNKNGGQIYLSSIEALRGALSRLQMRLF
jgi:hypothetical protein